MTHQLTLNVPRATFVVRLVGREVDVCELDNYLEPSIPVISIYIHRFLRPQLPRAVDKVLRLKPFTGNSRRSKGFRLREDDHASTSNPFLSSFIKFIFAFTLFPLRSFGFRKTRGIWIVCDVGVGDAVVPEEPRF